MSSKVKVEISCKPFFFPLLLKDANILSITFLWDSNDMLVCYHHIYDSQLLIWLLQYPTHRSSHHFSRHTYSLTFIEHHDTSKLYDHKIEPAVFFPLLQFSLFTLYFYAGMPYQQCFDFFTKPKAVIVF